MTSVDTPGTVSVTDPGTGICDRPDPSALLAACRRKGLSLMTAESCTGGLIAACLTDVAGSSDVVDRGFVTYSNEAKTELLGVPAGMIGSRGAVSAEVAAAMVTGAIAGKPGRGAIAVTGIAGPGGGSPDKPVGLVYIATGIYGEEPNVTRHIFTGDRAEVRRATVVAAVEQMTRHLA